MRNAVNFTTINNGLLVFSKTIPHTRTLGEQRPKIRTKNTRPSRTKLS